MEPNHFPSIRKAPFAMVLCSLFLAACVSEDGIEYDVPAGEQVLDLQLQIDADGVPVLLADVGMYYTTKAPLGPWDSKYVQSNVQSIALTGTAGGWKRHSFRNVQRNWIGRSTLIRNAKEQIHAIVTNRDRISLYGRDGAGWNLMEGSRILSSNQFGLLSLSTGAFAIMVEGERTMQSLTINFQSGRIEVGKSDGTAFILDSIADFSPISLVSREKFSMVLGFQRTYIDPNSPNAQGVGGGTARDSGLFSYSWNVGAVDPKPRKRKISDRNFIQLFFAKAQGEERMYALTRTDTLSEYSMRGEELTWLRDITITRNRNSGSIGESQPDSSYPASANLSVDPNGCIHFFAPEYGTPEGPDGPRDQPDYIHGSNCRTGVDTLKLPVPDTALTYQSRLTPLRFSPDGGILAGLLLFRTSKNPGDYIQGAAPSWIFLAKLVGRTWQFEKVLEYEGSAEEERSFR